jgi:hypothetical protein
MVEGHEKITVNQFLGIYSRGDTDNVPPNHFSDALNIVVDGDDIKTRHGSILQFEASNILRVHSFRKIGEATRFLVLLTGGELFESTDFGTAILQVVGMVDFSVASLYNRIYITPHDGVTGLPGEKVYVYDGSGLCRAAAGVAPTGFTLTVTESLDSGWAEEGERLFAVAYEMNSGYITAPGPNIYTSLVSTGDKKIDVSNIPIGPSGTVARHIICTKVIEDYNGNQSAQAYFFAYGGRIGNNTETTVTLDFFDGQLVNSADYLFTQLSTIPASLGLLAYQGSLITWGENSYPYMMRVSKQGEPESFNGEVGFLLIEPNDSSGVKNVVEYRSQIIICKSSRSSVTQRVPNTEAAFWEVVSVDPSIGTEINGVGVLLDTPGSFKDFFLSLTREGLALFNGSYGTAKLSDKITALWQTINLRYLHTTQCVIDSENKRVYCAVPTGVAISPNQLFVMDYSNGLTPESVAWYRWAFPVVPTTILLDIDHTTKEVNLFYGSTNFYKMSTSATADVLTAIDSYVITSKFAITDDESVNTFTGLRLRISGYGSLAITLSGEDDSNSKSLTAHTLAATPNKPVFRPLNYVSERMSVKLRCSSFGHYFRLRSFRIFGIPTWTERAM